MAFKNTVETVGDAALTRSIIDRSITELNCNLTTSIRQYAFRACAALASVNFPSVTSVEIGAFYGCTALTKAEFASVVAFATNAFQNCSALTALILRNTEQVSTVTDTTFASSAIASGTGYIYVPAALVDQYKASWATYASQIRAIEDYSAKLDPYTWDSVAANIADGSYASVYKIGDLVPLDMGTEGQINMQIAAFDADDLADGSGKAPISWISKELLKTSTRWNANVITNTDGTYQEGTGGIGGWEKSELRTYYNETLLPLIPEDVSGLIVPVTKTQDAHDTAGIKFTQTTNDSMWAPSVPEIIGSSALYYGLFKNTKANRIKYKVGATSATNWWTRTSGGSNYPNYIGLTGNSSSNSARDNNGIALCFCT